MRVRVLAGMLALIAACTLPASTKPAAEVGGGTLFFYNDSLAIAICGGAVLRLTNGAVVTGDAAYIDLRADHAVIAGNARITRGTAVVRGDAIAFDLTARRIDVLRAASGIVRTNPALTQETVADDAATAFAFPDLADGRAYIRARRAEIVSKTSVRFRPAAFPTSTGAPPVPMYLYTFANGNGYAATALSSAAFDQPYGLYASPNALTAVHLRYLNGSGPALGIEQNLIDDNDGYIAGAVDLPVHADLADGLNGYRRLGEAGTVSLNASARSMHRAPTTPIRIAPTRSKRISPGRVA